MEPKKTYTRRARTSRKTKASVRIAERAARHLITTGGIGTIVAVITVFLFLLYVVSPLFFSASVTNEHEVKLAEHKIAPVQMGLDEDQLMCWTLFPDGSLQVNRLATGELLEKRDLFDGKRLTAVSFTPGDEETAFGFADGSVRMGKIRFSSRFIDPDQLPNELRTLETGQSARWKEGVILKTPQDQFRLQELSVDIKTPAKAFERVPVLLIDQSKTTTGQVIAVLTADAKLRLNTVREKTNFNTGATTAVSSGIDLPYEEPPGKGPPLRLFMSAVGDMVFLFWKDGHLVRIDARDREKPVTAEVRDVLEDPRLQVTDVRCLLGKGTFLVGDSSGRVRAWFHAPSEQGGQMVCGHDFAGSGSAVALLAVSDRTRTAAAAYADGKIRLFYVTSERVMLNFDLGGEKPTSLVLAPKDDGLAASTDKGIRQWSFDPGHPEVTVESLFASIRYEGYDEPQTKWQSTGGDSFEPKFSLIPLIFGTLKASFYSLLFGVPMALLGAIFTSEFLHPRTKAVIKPTIEMMASLPSVVLGFLAGLVFAQFVEGVLPAVLASLLTVPLAFVFGAYLWQLLPESTAQKMLRWRFPFICLVLPLGMLAALPMGHFLEQALFAGNLRAWVDSGEGSSVGGWVFLLIPVCGMACLFILGKWVNPWLRHYTPGMSRFGTAVLDLAKFLSACVFTVQMAWLCALFLDWLGLDTRGSVFLGPYSQRNALIVGFAMGFAIIPIIYTIAEDALSAVPEHLRAGSLAAGATRWQTTIRIVIPTAMSGLFSAVMIGMGRAVGETMIMVMATGNTPVTDWSLYHGFRTLSANIAVELPESVRNSTHFRILFLTALTLFAMTFLFNTLAEIVRMRFRRRAYQL